MNIFVGNLSPDTTEEDLQQAFSAFGQVKTVTVIKDMFSRESKGFGFVEMQATAEAQAAINGLNGKELKGRALNVNEARPRPEGHRGGGRQGGGGGRHGGGGRQGGGGRPGGGGRQGGGRRF